MGWGELERRRHGDGPPDPLLGLVVVVRRFPVTGNVYVEIQESHNIVLRQHRLTPNEDVVVDVPNVAGLIDALTEAVAVRDIMEELDRAERGRS